jgi:hypothetical protein
VSVAFAAYLLVSKLFFEVQTFEIGERFLYRLLIGTSCGAAAYFAARVLRLSLAGIWGKHFRAVFYLSAVLFGLIHLVHFRSINAAVVLAAPLLVLPHIAAGLTYGYARVKYGIIAAVLLHAFSNALAIVR